jgi:hypothetical protein
MGTILNYTPRPGTIPAREACNTSEAMEIVAIANIKFWCAWQRTMIRAMWGV